MAKTPTLLINAASQRQMKQQGFTLLELLLVVAIIAIMTGLASLSIGGNDSRLLRQETERLQQLLLMAKDEAAFNQRNLGLTFTASGYHFSEYYDAEDLWQIIEEGPLKAHQYELTLHTSLELNGVALKLTSADKPGSPEPEILILSSGETSAFSISLQLPNETSQETQLTTDGFSPLTLRVAADAQ